MTKLALITVLDDFGSGHPGHDLPSGPAHPWYPGHGGGPRPGHDLPSGPPAHPWVPGHVGGPRPGHELPGAPVYPIYLPVWPVDPTVPDNTLPTPPGTPAPVPPPTTKPIEPGARFILKCTLAYGLILVPDAEPKPV